LLSPHSTNLQFNKNVCLHVFRLQPIRHSCRIKITIHGAQGGLGPAFLFLHGFPQDYHSWHRVALKLKAVYTVIALDLRGYGTSSVPKGSGNHVIYPKYPSCAGNEFPEIPSPIFQFARSPPVLRLSQMMRTIILSLTNPLCPPRIFVR
jgi:pimeloyl-ACP methyl ester carboxylesterase